MTARRRRMRATRRASARTSIYSALSASARDWTTTPSRRSILRSITQKDFKRLPTNGTHTTQRRCYVSLLSRPQASAAIRCRSQRTGRGGLSPRFSKGLLRWFCGNQHILNHFLKQVKKLGRLLYRRRPGQCFFCLDYLIPSVLYIPRTASSGRRTARHP